DHAELLYRSTAGSNTANIQMMNVINLWWAATMVDRPEFVTWGDQVFAGAVNFGMPSQQKARNQQMYLIFEALNYR
ncbi:MAG: hypothetical protein ACR2PH_12920, partial [Desulfobulbia bacterium]